jgi:hypothetical protein
MLVAEIVVIALVVIAALAFAHVAIRDSNVRYWFASLFSLAGAVLIFLFNRSS